MRLLDVYINLEKEFSKRGFSLYIVGGTSRDLLLGRRILDLDFATDALVSDMKQFLDVKVSYDEVGSLCCEFEGKKVDITTLRKEDKYDDYRHPTSVTYIKDTKEDSLRRDFTINAIYIDKNSNIIDYFNGRDDITSHIIRMIGNPIKRIKEDPLRILRAIRFALILDFSIDRELENAIRDNGALLKELNYAKCLNEIRKMIDFNKDKALALLMKYEVDLYIPIDYGFDKIPVCDMHCDTITRGSIKDDGIFSNEDLHIDITKMMKSRYLLQCFAVFINLSYGSPFDKANKYIDTFEIEMKKNQSFITPVTHYSEAMNAFSKNKIAALLTIEEGGVLEGKIENLYHFYKRGVRMMTLTWNYPNEIGHPNILINPGEKIDLNRIDDEKGLTSFGIEVVRKMNKLGMIIDVSHLSDAGFYDVMKYSISPIVASHSNSRSVHGVGRNLSDDMIKMISEKHGLIGINYCPDFLGDNKDVDQVTYMVNHIKRIRAIGGINCIALGSDFDGIGTPKGLEDSSLMHRLSDRLLQEGFSKEDIERIFYKNFLRLFKRICK